MTRLTKVATLATSILRQMPEIGKWQRQFLLLLFPLWLSIRGRHNFTNLARYGQYNEGAYRNNFSKSFDWLTFNHLLCEKALGRNTILAFDPSYISKSGKHTDGVGKFWSGCAGQVKHGLEISAIAAVDLDSNSALHLAAFQTLPRREGQTLLDYYAEGITKRKEVLLRVSKNLVADAYFSKAPFINKLTKEGFEVISRLRTDAKMRYIYQGAKEKKKGRPKQYDGTVDVRQLRMDVFSVCGKGVNDEWIAYTAIVNITSWKLSVRVVIIHHLDEQSQIKSHRILFSTDTELSGEIILIMYPARFQQEFLFRDAKQDLGLEHCQAYSAEKIDFHVNASLTVESLAKAAHHLLDDDANRVENELLRSFSIADVKTEYVNEHRALRILSMCNVDLNLPIIRKMMPAIREYGKRRV